MSKKQKAFLCFIIMLLIILLIKSCTINNKLNYTIKVKKNSFNVLQLKENKSTYIEIKHKGNIYPIKIYKNYKNNKQLITNIYYYKDSNYECVVPEINKKIIIDGMCYNNNILYNLNDLSESNELKKFVNSIPNYDKKVYSDNLSSGVKTSTITYYKSNKIDKSVAVSTYKGLYNKGKIVNIFKKDIYENNLHIFLDHYYVSADYNSIYTFNKFYVVDLYTNKVKELKLDNDISFDSYIQGVVDNKIYLYDKDNELQYEIDPAKNKIVIISNDKVRYYKNSKWESISYVKANKGVLFDFTSLDDPYKDKELYRNNDGTIYYLIDNNKLYKINKESIDTKKYLRDIDSNIKASDDYIYFIEDNILYYYSDSTGFKKILKNTEFEFNKTIQYYIY